jgi:hypothetical protein
MPFPNYVDGRKALDAQARGAIASAKVELRCNAPSRSVEHAVHGSARQGKEIRVG